MSSVKHPKEKKRLSLDHDRRNVVDENKKAGRKNLPKAKQRSRMHERRSTAQLLSGLSGHVEEERAAEVEFAARLQSADNKHFAFKKVRDIPLREHIQRQKNRETRNQRRARP